MFDPYEEMKRRRLNSANGNGMSGDDGPTSPKGNQGGGSNPNQGKMPGPDKNTVTKNMENRYPTQRGNGDFTDSDIEFPEPTPEQPSEEMKQRARDGEESDEDREIIRNFRQWAARKGEWENEQLANGVVPKMKVSRLNMISNYGSDFANVDLAGKREWTTMSGVPDGKGGVTPAGGGWIPMSNQTYNDIMKYRSQRDSARGEKFQGQFGTGGVDGKADLSYIAVQKMRGIDDLVKRGHWTLDQASGTYYNVGGGDPSDKNTWDWYDQFGNQMQGPPENAGAKGNGKAGMDPNHYEYNEMAGKQYPNPGQPFPGMGSAGVTTRTTLSGPPKNEAPGGRQIGRDPIAAAVPTTRTMNTNAGTAAWGGIGPSLTTAPKPKSSNTTAAPIKPVTQPTNTEPSLPKKKKTLTGTQGLQGTPGLSPDTNSFGTY